MDKDSGLEKNEGSGDHGIANGKQKEAFGDTVPVVGEVEAVDGGSEETSEDAWSEGSDEETGKDSKKKKYSLMLPWKLFRFASCLDAIFVVLGVLGSIGVGAALPIHMLLFGDVLTIMINYTTVSIETLPNIVYLSNNCTGVSSNGQNDNVTLGHFCLPLQANGTALPAAFQGNESAVSNESLTLINELQQLISSRQGFLTDCTVGNRSIYLQQAQSRFTTLNDYFYYTEMQPFVFIYLGIAVGALICGYLQAACLTVAAYHQGYRIRQRFLRSLMFQDNSWYDTNKASSLSTRLADDVEKIQSGLGDRMGLFLQYTTTFLVGYIVGFIRGWQLTLVIITVLPLLLLVAIAFALITAKLVKFEQKNYAAAGAIAEEVLGAIRTVAAFGGESRAVERYGKELKRARKVGYFKSLIVGALLGLLFFILFASYALAFGYGSQLILECNGFTAGQIITVFLSVLIGTFSLGQALPELETFASAMGSASYVFAVIDRQPEIVSDPNGAQPETLNGEVEFKDVTFNYPARPTVEVLKGLSFTAAKGQTLALVGPSGCGKSTTVQLLQRFYDVKGGEILIDGKDIALYNLDWLRSKIGIVSQEPSLFSTSITENIRLGYPTATQKEIEQAAKSANAHDFIMNLPDKYDTVIGSRAAQLSGGQKQRIAIARALVRDPKILLLDEATSALDNESESIVQAALDKARQGRTTIVIAHRLSTIRTADTIASIKGGVVVESGTHMKLMSVDNGLYRELVTAQSSGAGDTEDEPLADFKAALEKRPSKLSFKMKKRGTKMSLGTPGTPSTPYSQYGGTPTSDLNSYEAATPYTPGRDDFVSRDTGPEPIPLRDVHFAASLECVHETGEIVVANGGATARKGQFRRFTQGFSKLRKLKNDEEEEKLPSVPLKELIALNLPDWYLVIPGVITAGLVGVLFPLLAVVFSGAIAAFGSTDREVVRAGGVFYAGMFLAIAAGAGLFNFISAFFLNVAAERLTKRLRLQAFKAMLRQDVGWFDQPRNAPGALSTRLAVDATDVKGATGLRFGTTFQLVVGLLAAVVVAFTASWELSLVVMLCFPLIFLAGFFQLRLQAGRAGKNKETFESSGNVSAEAFENIKTIQSFGLEENRFNAYRSHLRKAVMVSMFGAVTQGFVAAIAQSLVFLMYTIGFAFGPYLMVQGRASYDDVYRVFIAVVVTSLSLGRAASFSGDLDKAKLAAARILSLIKRQPSIDVTEETGMKKDKVDGSIVFRNVEFSYPTRQEVPVLNRLNLTVQPGQKVALVGPSGCGKSTVVSLLERFYDPTRTESGSVTLDGEDLRDVNLKWLRSQIGIVSQEPVLFNASIADNIRYGVSNREVSNEEVEKAARDANIHNFIASLPRGYDTDCGARGTQLSGGQKQRIAIARALVRDPKILLLDEATSALDTESEKIVQEALDRAQEGRTCIVIAHRLSTIQRSDLIVVIHAGKVLETGTHQSLMALRGAYYLLSTVTAGGGGPGTSISKIAEMSAQKQKMSQDLPEAEIHQNVSTSNNNGPSPPPPPYLDDDQSNIQPVNSLPVVAAPITAEVEPIHTEV